MHRFLATLCLLALPLAQALAWGATGHEFISGVAAEALPDEIPAFLRTPAVAADIAVLGREMDRSRSSAQTVHSAERDPGHFINLDDIGTAAGVVLDPMPPTREAYDTALRAKGSTQYKQGYLPYAVIDGWYQLVKDFAYWRAGTVAMRNAVDSGDRAWFAEDRARRERLIVRDLGVWSHFVGDASQPMHLSIHYDDWGKFPNPRNFSQMRGLHARFEGEFLRANVQRAEVAKRLAPYRECGGCGIEERTRALILESHAQVVPLFELEQQGGFSDADPRGAAFIASQLAHGSSALRDMIVDAWRMSAHVKVGYPEVPVEDIEAGRRILSRGDFGND